jgi:Zn finger protein HypA/HybF involved in hydrogenase expression
MHEAGLARAIAKALRDRPAAPVPGHPHEEFDSALRFHLASEAPELDPARLEVVHLPAGRLCTGCGRSYEAADPGEPCPTCGGASLPLIEREQVEIELLG